MADPVVLSYHDSLLRESDLALLDGRNWLNDALIAFWLEYIQRQCSCLPHDQGTPGRLCCVSPEVTQLVKLGDPSEIGLFLDPLEASHVDYLLLPVNDNSSVVSSGGSHWSLLVYSRSADDGGGDGKWYHYDSMRGSNYRDARALVQRINRYLSRDAVLVDASCTQQNNSYDCGAFVMLNAQHAASVAATATALGSNCVPRYQAQEMRVTLLELISQLKGEGGASAAAAGAGGLFSS